MRNATLAMSLLLFAACAGLGDMGGILGSPSADQPSDVRGTVSNVDRSAQRIDLNVAYVNNLRNESSGQSVYYDSRTTVMFEGREFRVDDLERGDEVSIRGANVNGRYVAETITVTRDVSR